MSADPETAEERSHRSGAMSIDEFVKRYNIAATRVYAEIRAGRLLTKRLGARRLISDEAAQAWFDALPAA